MGCIWTLFLPTTISDSLAPRGTSGERVGERGRLANKLSTSAPPLPGPLLHSEWRRGPGRGGADVLNLFAKRPLSPTLSPLVPRGARESEIVVGKNSVQMHPMRLQFLRHVIGVGDHIRFPHAGTVAAP